jgi:hypothetical protein
MTRYAIVDLIGQRALVPMHDLPGDMPELAEALARRNVTVVTGRCPCGASVRLPNRAERRRAARHGDPGVQHLVVHHEVDCPATDESIAEMRKRSS